MKQFLTVLKFELKNYLENKVFIGVTVVMVLLSGILTFGPRVLSHFDTDTEAEEVIEDTNGAAEKDVMLVALYEGGEYLEPSIQNTFDNYDVQFVNASRKELRNSLKEQKAECAFEIDSPLSYTYYVKDLGMMDSNTEIIESLLQNQYQLQVLQEKGMTVEEAGSFLSAKVEGNVEKLGKNQMANFFYAYIMIFALYFVILIYGQMISANVATEKSSRAMELLVTSVRPIAMMFGKVIASCLAGLLQIICIFGSSFLFYQMNESYIGGNALLQSLFGIPSNLLGYMCIFFTLGFLIYAFLFGAIGSTVSKLEDINTVSMPIVMVFVIGFLVVMFSMSSGSVDSTLMQILSYIPFTSPMAMFARIAMTTVPFDQILLSIGILTVSVYFIGVISAKIYRVGVMMYGNPPKVKDIIRMLKQA